VKRRDDLLPHVVVDGCFSVPIQRIGCPDFSQVNGNTHSSKSSIQVDRTVTVSCFPEQLLTLTSKKHDRIGPKLEENAVFQAIKTVTMATQASRRQDLIKLFEEGWSDGERWSFAEERRKIGLTRKDRRKKYAVALMRKYFVDA